MSNWLDNLLSRIFCDFVAQLRPDVSRSRRSHNARRRAAKTSSNTGQHPSGSRRTGGSGCREYPGDSKGTPRITYSPAPGEEAGPGEVVQTWVPYEEDHRDDKDRPVLTIGRDHERLLGLLLTSKGRGRDIAQEARCRRLWVGIGTGERDPQRRPSEARTNRILRIGPDGVRRVGAVLDHKVFEAVTAVVRA